MNEGRVAVNPWEEQVREIELPDIGVGTEQPAEHVDDALEEEEAVISIVTQPAVSTSAQESGSGGASEVEMTMREMHANPLKKNKSSAGSDGRASI